MEGKVVFPDINVLVKFVLNDLDKYKREKTPLRLQKTLYFLFAFYGATYGQLRKEKENDKVFEGSENYPKYLFNEDFEAWNYGPVIRKVYTDFKYNPDRINQADTWEIDDDEQKKNIYDVLSQVIKQTIEMGDFELVDRTHEDDEWKQAHENNQGVMEKDAIIEGYKPNVF